MKIADTLAPMRPLAEVLPDLAERVRGNGGNPDESQPRRVFGTRRLAREVIATQSTAPLVLDFDGVQVASSPFIDELVTAWPAAVATNMNVDVAETWALVQERR